MKRTDSESGMKQVFTHTEIVDQKSGLRIFGLESESVPGETEYRECDWIGCSVTANFENLVGVQLCSDHIIPYYQDDEDDTPTGQIQNSGDVNH